MDISHTGRRGPLPALQKPERRAGSQQGAAAGRCLLKTGFVAFNPVYTKARHLSSNQYSHLRLARGGSAG